MPLIWWSLPAFPCHLSHTPGSPVMPAGIPSDLDSHSSLNPIYEYTSPQNGYSNFVPSSHTLCLNNVICASTQRCYSFCSQISVDGLYDKSLTNNTSDMSYSSSFSFSSHSYDSDPYWTPFTHHQISFPSDKTVVTRSWEDKGCSFTGNIKMLAKKQPLHPGAPPVFNTVHQNLRKCDIPYNQHVDKLVSTLSSSDDCLPDALPENMNVLDTQLCCPLLNLLPVKLTPLASRHDVSDQHLFEKEHFAFGSVCVSVEESVPRNLVTKVFKHSKISSSMSALIDLKDSSLLASVNPGILSFSCPLLIFASVLDITVSDLPMKFDNLLNGEAFGVKVTENDKILPVNCGSAFPLCWQTVTSSSSSGEWKKSIFKYSASESNMETDSG
ncbi:uncharacterized protein [Palaemon carinicauda]|uniref:uncharacterized protein n=1 Tax=Palaemon carinicauda TaxID=392227 RepID=UPI0035B695ED